MARKYMKLNENGTVKVMPSKSEQVLPRRSIAEVYLPDELKGATQILTGFYKADGTEITFFETHPEGSMESVLQDACGFLKDADKAGVILKPSILADLARTYGIKVSEDLSLFDAQRGDPEDRKYRFTQCLVGFDAMLRAWGAAAPARIDPEKE